MSDLKVKTRGDCSPQGKPRVYISCHQEDFALCFEMLAEEILQRQNCAIWYETDWDSAMDETQLSQMQLFIVPITTKYLTHPSRSRCEEYRFAIQQHIPVLPIMLESGLEAGFAEIMNKEGPGFGDLQLLNRADEDNTAISYVEKLDKRLSAVLTNDETAALVRAAFDAYIFLGYRKKDRAAAQSLMRLIHQIPYCRDIAIWYDEFLVPGEQWEKSILEAMERSQLVTFAITPHIMERGNYVKEYEFPEAMRSGKPVVPAEVEATDRETLMELFPGMPEPVDGKSHVELEQVLRQIPIEENGHDPAHNYLIGLAYLGAIDVERDADRAVQLIRGAAEAGLPEAIAKLVEMYGAGEGVSRDYSAAVEWQKRLVALHRRAFRETQSEAEADSLFAALWRLFDWLDVLRREGEQWRIAQEMLKTAAYTGQAKRRRNLLASYGKLGDIAQAGCQLEEAKASYEQGIIIARELAEEMETVDSFRNLSISYSNLGDIAKARGRLEEAKISYMQALAICKMLVEETGTMDSRRNLSICYEKLGNIARDERRLEEARDIFERSHALRKVLAEEARTIESRRALFHSYNKLGEVAQDDGQLEEAKASYEQCLTIAGMLVKETGTLDSRRNLSISYSNLGDIAKAENRLEEARSRYEQSLKLRIALAEEAGTLESFRDLSISYNRMGDIAKAQDQLEEAKISYERSLELRKTLEKKKGTPESRRDLSIGYSKIGDIAVAQGRWNEAKASYEQCLELRKALAEEMETLESLRDLSISYGKLGNLACAWERMEEAKAYYEQELVLCKMLAEKVGSRQSYDELAITYISLGQVAEFESEEQVYLLHAVRIYQMLVEEHPQVERYRNILDSLDEYLKTIS